MWLLDTLLKALIRRGQLVVTDYDGTVRRYGIAAADSVSIAIRLTDRRVATHIARDPRVGAGEAYMDGRLVVEPPHDIRDFVLFITAQRDRARLRPHGPWRRAIERVAARIDQANDRMRARRNIGAHYDLSRAFYELFLDEDRQYSMAYYRQPANDLERAQLDKKALIAAKLRIGPGMRVLDIGGGWGGLALYLNRNFGCSVTGVSLAPDQVRFANERAAAAGVAHQVRFELVDYRDLAARPGYRGGFDRIVSVGMIEHVGKRGFDEYFARTRELLRDDGIALVHTIGRARGPGITDKWTRKYVFPGGYIPALSELVAPAERNGWEIGDIEVLRYHYALTLEEWYRRTCRHEAEITALYDARLFRMWQFYLAGAEQAFRHGGLVNFHVQLAKRRDALPMTRDYIGIEAARLTEAETAPHWRFDTR